VREFAEKAFAHAGLDWERHVEYGHRYSRPTDVDLCLCDTAKSRRSLGWEPMVTFEGLVQMMVDANLLTAESR
jgi:GDPmannose 4,6-dehydratase